MKTVSIQGRTVTFHDLRDLKNLIREIEENIAAQATPSEVPETARTIQARFKIK
ncbi:MAG: hypothetical protein RBT63_07295 [Bdellovibrionales bacterium]|nr:hypothetical protein [Bdellovibrionales bacterium]